MFLVTGASGHIGGRVARLLAQRGAPVRRLMRQAGSTPDLPGSTVAIGDYGDRASLARAMDGVDTVFLASAGAPPLKRAALHGNVMDVAAGAGVKRLVYLSFQGASATSPFPYSADHLLSEAHLKQSGLAWTILRDSFYQDLIPTLPDAEGVIRDPGGDGKVAWVARDDVARTVAAVLLDDRHAGHSYDVTGPEALSLEEAVARLAAAKGGVPSYRRETLEEGRAWRAATGAAAWEVEVWLGSYLAMGTGELARVSGAVREITGRDPVPLAKGRA
ncbi:SDR family oxidoreductase [Marinivivus vitaminiproducens]|uniref:SDR family oxidoreductase n=1 Tax=Marinivivus vitaminiproducens TaxID=3035935 RepID=UPI0027A1BE1D|nr:SDR family oxidoreductase [Geminicoccaceae bacterium SCSIO 64248]